jgi:hypothetical protein
MIDDRAIPLAYRFTAPSAWQHSCLPVLVHESNQVLPPLRFVERISGHQEICPTRKFGGAENSLILIGLMQPVMNLDPSLTIGTQKILDDVILTQGAVIIATPHRLRSANASELHQKIPRQKICATRKFTPASPPLDRKFLPQALASFPLVLPCSTW